MGSDGDRTMNEDEKAMMEGDGERMNSSWSGLPNRFKEFLPAGYLNHSLKWVFCAFVPTQLFPKSSYMIKVRCGGLDAYYSFYSTDKHIWQISDPHAFNWFNPQSSVFAEVEYDSLMSLMSLMSEHFEMFI